MLGYVAVTRARLVLDTGGLAWIHDHAAAHGIVAEAVDAASSPAVPVLEADGGPHDQAMGYPPRAQPSPRPKKEPSPPRPEPADVLAQVGLALGMSARVDGESGVWRLIGFAKDGSVSAVGGPCGQWRSFMPEWCYPAERTGRRGRPRRGTLPPERRGLRAAWRAEHGLAALAVDVADSPLP